MIDLEVVFLTLDYWVHWIGLEREFIAIIILTLSNQYPKC
jgi:hypothetical protein